MSPLLNGILPRTFRRCVENSRYYLDDEGQVMRVWVGLLNAEREAELIGTVFG